MQADMVLEKELRVLHLDSKATRRAWHPQAARSATSTPVVTSVTGPENLGAVPRRKVHGNLVSWNRGILYKECSNVLALVGKRICVLSLNIALL